MKHEWKDSLTERFEIYHLLQHLFQAAPTTEFLTELPSLFKEPREGDSFKQGLGPIKQDLLALDDQVEANIRWDYTRLFVGPSKLLAPPYESVYCSSQRLVMQESTAKIREEYQEAGLSVLAQGEIPDDHVAIEFEFMKSLCAIALNTLEHEQWRELGSVLECQEKFLAEHLTQWIPRFTHDIQENANTSFYKGAAELTKEFIEDELEIVKKIIKSLK